MDGRLVPYVNLDNSASTPPLREDDFDRQLAKYTNRVALVAVSGASNVTGFLQPIHRLARKAHDAGAKILVDAAQLAPHRPIDMKPDDDPDHLDFVALSAHKMYAPFGTGALIGPKEIYLQSGPEYSGGGVVDVVTLDEVHLETLHRIARGDYQGDYRLERGSGEYIPVNYQEPLADHFLLEREII